LAECSQKLKTKEKLNQKAKNKRKLMRGFIDVSQCNIDGYFAIHIAKALSKKTVKERGDKP